MLEFPQTPEVGLSSRVGKKRNWESMNRDKKRKEASGVRRTDCKTCLAGHFCSSSS